jgi:hypothetical protein
LRKYKIPMSSLGTLNWILTGMEIGNYRVKLLKDDKIT